MDRWYWYWIKTTMWPTAWVFYTRFRFSWIFCTRYDCHMTHDIKWQLTQPIVPWCPELAQSYDTWFQMTTYAICSALVPRTLALSNFVRYGVVLRFSGSTFPGTGSVAGKTSMFSCSPCKTLHLPSVSYINLWAFWDNLSYIYLNNIAMHWNWFNKKSIIVYLTICHFVQRLIIRNIIQVIILKTAKIT